MRSAVIKDTKAGAKLTSDLLSSTRNEKAEVERENLRLKEENSELSTALRNLNAEYQKLRKDHQKEKATRTKLEDMVNQLDEKFQDMVYMSKWYKQRVKKLEERLMLE